MIQHNQSDHVETLVIGGSQAGLATGYHLAQHGRPFLIVDEHERVGGAWRSRWDSLRLFTTAPYSGLPGMPFPGARSYYPTKNETADYLEAYAARFQLPVRTGVKVERLTRSGNVLEAVTSGHSLYADNVVVATGAYRTPRVPEFGSDLDADVVQLHSSQYRNPAQLQPGGVLVVGAGNSGAEIAIELSRHHQIWLSGRDTGQEPTSAGSLPDRLLLPLMWFVASHVLTVRTPIGRKVADHFLHPPRGIPLGRVRRRDIAAAGIERVTRVVAVRQGRPVLEDGTVLDVANVIWCTGFDPDLSWIDLQLTVRDGFPANDRGVIGDQPGLYIVGMPFIYSLTSALLGGVGRDAAYITDHIADRMRDTRVAESPS